MTTTITEPLTISHLHISYQLFFDKTSQYYLEDIENQNIEDADNNFSYCKVLNKKFNDIRILFPPVTTQNIIHPTAKSLDWALKYLTETVLFQIKEPIKKVIIPVGEMFNFLGLMENNHMLTLIIEFQNNGAKTIYLIDSKSFSLPGSKTQLIHDTLNTYLNNFTFQRYYVHHQNIIDRMSCCYFSFKFIHLALMCKDMNDFMDEIPRPDTIVCTSKSLLTDVDESSILHKIKNYYQHLENVADQFVVESF